ncbi:transmembrane protein 267-like isoform X2 [Hydractinia symbiolongicarpus]|uniref:transmembrane protein 267-like isoform X2 n=1 Tax=Hydractinia symbiolongicarpus TaxID=13093 RepID=UPI00254B5662|nr:transmembrane protein 267-like isoform X2 [Hydractinia symbiolongicarpus]
MPLLRQNPITTNIHSYQYHNITLLHGLLLISFFAWHLDRAYTGNEGHGIVAAIAWLVILDYQHDIKSLMQVILCGMAACCIDVDHFLHAGSLKLQDAVHLSSRPPFHNSSIFLILFLLLLLQNFYLKLNSMFSTFLLIIITAFVSHHLRDGNRRGLWFWPLGSTRALSPDFVYITAECLLPACIWKIQWMLNVTAEAESITTTLDV